MRTCNPLARTIASKSNCLQQAYSDASCCICPRKISCQLLYGIREGLLVAAQHGWHAEHAPEKGILVRDPANSPTDDVQVFRRVEKR
jgi:hypothetical protein